MDAQQEIGIEQHALERELNAAGKVSGFRSTGVKELDQRLQITSGHGAPVREPRVLRKDARGARCLLRGRCRLADEDRARGRARRPADAGRRVRSGDLHRADAGIAHVHLIVGDDPPTLERLRQALRLPQLPHERNADNVWTGGDFRADLQPGVSADLHVLFPRVVAGETRFAVSRITRRSRPALGSAADGKPLDELPVKANVELLRPAHPLDVVLILPLEPDLDDVLAVKRKIKMNREAATGAERQIFVLPVVLYDMQWDFE